MRGKNILITGASRGIGAKAAEYLSGLGANVILVARNKEKLERVKNNLSGETLIMPCDLTNNDNIEALFNDLQKKKIKLDGMVYCAGIYFVKPLKIMEKNDLEEMFKINVFGFYEMCRYFTRNAVSNKDASIVGISSYAALSKETGTSAYSMTKAAMNVQAQVLAKEFMKRRIRINTVMPAIVMSKIGETNNDWTEEEIAQIKDVQPLGIIPIEDVVKSVGFLMSEDAKHITGECLSISSGYRG